MTGYEIGLFCFYCLYYMQFFLTIYIYFFNFHYISTPFLSQFYARDHHFSLKNQNRWISTNISDLDRIRSKSKCSQFTPSYSLKNIIRHGENLVDLVFFNFHNVQPQFQQFSSQILHKRSKSVDRKRRIFTNIF